MKLKTKFFKMLFNSLAIYTQVSHFSFPQYPARSFTIKPKSYPPFLVLSRLILLLCLIQA
jgi:hypothetical protein